MFWKKKLRLKLLGGNFFKKFKKQLVGQEKVLINKKEGPTKIYLEN